MQLITASDRYPVISGLLVDVLAGLPAAQQLGLPAVKLLLQAAVDKDSYACVPGVCSLPAALQLTSGQVLQLLWTANQTPPKRLFLEMGPQLQYLDCSTHSLCKLPAAQHISSDDLGALLLTAVQHGNQASALHLCELQHFAAAHAPLVSKLASMALLAC
jgi:hypothetical protein